MAVFKCKMCGASLDVKLGDKVVLCEYCESQNTLPNLDDEKRMNLYDRANHFRRKNEYDKAMTIYEQILSEDGTDSEAYWSIVLCRYGIDYVEDPKTHKRIPTINRMQNQSILADVDYLKAIEYADVVQKDIYIKQAEAINEIQKKIHQVVEQTEAFDIFICYKRSDENQRRTIDSVRASELYQELTKEGYKTFFAEITLEDKLGVEYEPYIFSALQSSKIMIVIGSKKEYFDAVWVKNEWSRYLSLMNKGEKKYLIPVYLNMDPYDLPTEFSYLQAQDMGKLGFVPDLIRGIKKLIGDKKDISKEVKKDEVTSSTTNSLEKRVSLFLEDGDFQNAKVYCEKILDINPENAFAYIGKLLVENSCKSLKDLSSKSIDYQNNNNYQKAYRFGTSDQKKQLEETLKGSLYSIAAGLISENIFEESSVDANLSDYDFNAIFEIYDELIPKYQEIIKKLKVCQGYKEADNFINYYQEKINCYKEFNNIEIKQAYENQDFGYCRHLIENISSENYSKEAFLKNLQKGLLESIDEREQELEEEEKAQALETKKKIQAEALARERYQQLQEEKKIQYEKAVEYMKEHDFYGAMCIFEEIKPYKDAEEKYQICKHEEDKLASKIMKKRKVMGFVKVMLTLLITSVANVYLYWKYATSFTVENEVGTANYLIYTYIILALFVVINFIIKVRKGQIIIGYILSLIVNLVALVILSGMYPLTGGIGEGIVGGIIFAIIGAVVGFIVLLICNKIDSGRME